MPDQPRQIGPYALEREIGRGGMGVVYLGRDSDLGRAVAIKVLPEAFASDPERLARLDREAKLLASVSHPNVAGIYGVGEDAGLRYLALEHVPGETLAAHLVQGPLPIREALDVARQIAAGLEAAHDAGVVHRDLKPSNVLLTPAGEVKVLDFGLAKGPVTEISSSSLDASPTATYHLTSPGVVLGTAAYMSPEQARGKPVDRRTDLWALGCILFECLTGHSPFAADTASDTLARILEREPDWEALPAELPAKVRDMLRRCLEKDPRSRMRDAGDARLELEEAQGLRSSSSIATAETATIRSSRRRRRVAAPLGILLVGSLLGGAVVWWAVEGRVHPAPKRLHLSVPFPSELEILWGQLSSNGDVLVLKGSPRKDPDATSRLYLRPLGVDDLREVPGTQNVGSCRISPDGRWLYFQARAPGELTETRLSRAPIDGSVPAVEIAEWDPAWGSWTVLHGGDVLVVRAGTELVHVTLEGGVTGKPIPIDAGRPGRFHFTDAPPLAGDHRVLMSMENWSERGFRLSTVLLDPTTGKAQVLLEEGGSAWAVGDLLLFTRSTRLLGVRFDPRTGRTRGQVASLAGDLGVGEAWESAWFNLSVDGTLAYVPGGILGNDRRLLAVTASGSAEPWSSEARPFTGGALAPSPDGRSLAVILPDAKGKYEIWRITPQGSPQPLVTPPEADTWFPIWSPDGKSLVYVRTSRREGDGVYLVSLDAPDDPRLLLRRGSDVSFTPESWSPDSSRLFVTRRTGGRPDIIEILVDEALAAEGAIEPRALVSGSSLGPRLSPDGRRLMFTSNDSGRDEVYVASYREDGTVGPRQPVSQGRAGDGRWSPDGRKVYFNDQRGHILSMTLDPEGAPVGEPTIAADLDEIRAFPWFAVLPDGRLVFVQKSEREDDIDRVDLVLGFGAELERRIP